MPQIIRGVAVMHVLGVAAGACSAVRMASPRSLARPAGPATLVEELRVPS